jgi:hypothetical protein
MIGIEAPIGTDVAQARRDPLKQKDVARGEVPVWNALVARHRHHHEDTTTHEIVQLLAMNPETAHWNDGMVAKRLADLKAKGLVHVSEEKRHDFFTRRMNYKPVSAVYIPATQSRLFK